MTPLVLTLADLALIRQRSVLRLLLGRAQEQADQRVAEVRADPALMQHTAIQQLLEALDHVHALRQATASAPRRRSAKPRTALPKQPLSEQR